MTKRIRNSIKENLKFIVIIGIIIGLEMTTCIVWDSIVRFIFYDLL